MASEKAPILSAATDNEKLAVLLAALEPFAKAGKRIRILGAPNEEHYPLAAVDAGGTQYAFFSSSRETGDMEDVPLTIAQLTEAYLAYEGVQGLLPKPLSEG